MTRIERSMAAGMVGMLLAPVLAGLIKGWTFVTGYYVIWALNALMISGIVYYLSGHRDPR